MTRCVFSCVAVFLLLPLVTFSEEALSLETAINTAVKNNYEIKRQRIALELAQAKYRQVRGALDVEIGAEASYTMSQQPVDHDDPNYVVDTGYDANRNLITIYADNVLSQQTSGSLFYTEALRIRSVIKIVVFDKPPENFTRLYLFRRIFRFCASR